MDDDRTPEATPDNPEPTAPRPGAIVPYGADTDAIAGPVVPDETASAEDRPPEAAPGDGAPVAADDAEPPTGGTGGGAGGTDGGTGGGADGAAPPPGDAPPRRLRRVTENRVLGGVAAGVAAYLGVDVVIVRVAFAVLTVFGGFGALAYLAAWLLIPADDEEHPLAQQWAGRRSPRRNLILIGLGIALSVIALSDLFSSGPWWPHRNGNISLAVGAVALVLALSLVVGSGGNRTAASRLRWLFMMLVLAVVAVVVVVAATVFSIEAASGVPLHGGVGDTQFHPTAANQLVPTYRLAVGNLNVDLSAVPFRAGTTHVTASVGIGQLTVEVPPGPTVSVVAHSGLGDVQVFGQDNRGLSTVQTMESKGAGSASNRHIVITADVGVGHVKVIRTEPDPAFS
jgi:phage shock protein PspC (stress-responsive transcriptional regulator)